MNKFQKVSFRSLDDFFDFLPENELRIVELLRDLVLDVLPEPTEKLSFNVPHYRCYKTVCFIWPSSVGWGGIKEGVLLGFIQGYLMLDEDNYLETGSRKYVKTHQFLSPQDIDYSKVRTLLLEASAVDDELRRASANKRKKSSI